MLCLSNINSSVSFNDIWQIWSSNQISYVICSVCLIFILPFPGIWICKIIGKNTWKMCLFLKLWECLYQECGTLPFSDKSWINPRWSQGISPVISATCPKNQKKIVHEIVHFICRYVLAKHILEKFEISHIF